jgi:Ca-activated chloride channel family protein
VKLLQPFLFDSLAHPAVLVLLLGVILLFIAEFFARTPGCMTVSTGEALARLVDHRGAWLGKFPVALRALGLAFLIVALAEPLNGFQVRKDRVDVIDILLCVDVSGSMREEDFVSGGERRSRLFVTKEAVRDFIESRKDDSGDRYGYDRLGLVLYGGYAWTQCPLTLDYGLLDLELERAHIDESNEDKSGKTAIGSAIGLAVLRLSESEAKSKVIILLTDGLNNAGDLDPITAAQLAKKYDMRVYTIGAGSAEKKSPTGLSAFFGGSRHQPIDEKALRKIAEETGGKYYRATDTDSLQEAYAEINELETTEIDIGDYYEYKQAFMPYVLTGGLLLLVSIFSKRKWFEAIP